MVQSPPTSITSDNYRAAHCVNPLFLLSQTQREMLYTWTAGPQSALAKRLTELPASHVGCGNDTPTKMVVEPPTTSVLLGGFNPSENISQLGWFFPIYGKLKMLQTTNNKCWTMLNRQKRTYLSIHKETRCMHSIWWDMSSTNNQFEHRVTLK